MRSLNILIGAVLLLTSSMAAANGTHVVSQFIKGPMPYRMNIRSPLGGDLVRDKLGYMAAQQLSMASKSTLYRALKQKKVSAEKRPILELALARKKYPLLAEAADTLGTGRGRGETLGHVLAHYKWSVTLDQSKRSLRTLSTALTRGTPGERQAAMMLVKSLKQLDSTLQSGHIGFPSEKRYAYPEMEQAMKRLFSLARP